MSHLTYPEAGLIGLIQGVTELFPISSLGHSVLIPALIGGSWSQDLDVSKAESPYLAYIVGLHVATALAMIIYFWRDWVRIIGAFFASVKHVIAPAPGTERWEPQTTDQKLAWMIVLATIPVGIAGLALEHQFRTVFSKPVLTSLFLFANGLILLPGSGHGGATRPWRRSRSPPTSGWSPSGRRPRWRRAATGAERGIRPGSGPSSSTRRASPWSPTGGSPASAG
ncbi:MAG TPA: undecaprenyl-diphosphate phosphatase [Streptosporangiaceae bacterium]|nr:undecaprenyl-diphosphate phosphatase [Streptosporangiaceae bacterium]